MKPYNKNFLCEKLNEYNNIIDEINIGSLRVVKKREKLKELSGYMNKCNDEEYINTIELIDGANSLMKLDSREIEGDFEAIRFAKGNVGIVGLGLGYTAREISLKNQVEKVTVYENNKDVIDLYKKNFGENDKIEIIYGDAFKAHKDKFDFFFVDIYNYELSDKVVDDYKKFNEIHQIEEYSFWGMEHFLLSCNYEDLIWVYIPENWVEMCKHMYEKLQSSGYINNYEPLDEKKVTDILMKFKEVLNEGM